MQTVTIVIPLPDGISEDTIRGAIRQGFTALTAQIRSASEAAARAEAKARADAVVSVLGDSMDAVEITFT